MGRLKEKYLHFAAFALIAFYLMLLAYRLYPMNILKYNHWVYTEWWISYSGGWVRRGLFGYVLSLSGLSLVTATNLLIAILNLTLVGLGLNLIITSSGKIKVIFFLAFLLGTFGILNHIIFEYYFDRKEVVSYIVLFIISIFNKNDRRSYFSVLQLLLCIFLILIALFNHESFILAHGMLLFILLNGRIGRKRQKLTFACIILSAFLLTVIFHGNASISDKIWNGIHEADKKYLSGPMAINALGWSFKQGVSFTFSEITDVYLLFNWLIPLLLFSFSTGLVFKYLNLSKRHVLLFILVNPGVLLLFILGADWGRWLDIGWFNLLVIILNLETFKYYADKLAEFSIFKRFERNPATLANNRGGIQWDSPLLPVFFIIATFIKIPECCLNNLTLSDFYHIIPIVKKVMVQVFHH